MPMFKKSMLVLLALVALAAGGAVFYGYRAQEEAVPLDAGEVVGMETQEIVVYVSGAVNRPGLVRLAEGARAQEAVDACGGFLPTADRDGVNLAQKLKDGMQVKVPEKVILPSAGTPQGEAALQAGGAKGGAIAVLPDGRININVADEKELDKLPGIGPAMAKRIVEYRMENGPFQTPEEIKHVKGIGDAKFEKMKDKIAL